MTNRHRIVVSAENNAYSAWQAKLFYYSCVSRLGHQPLVVVHQTGDRWQSDFCDLARAGAVVRPAPNYRAAPAGTYYPRNTAGTLLHAVACCDRDDDFIVLVDADMIVVRPPTLPATLAAASYANMNYERDEVGIAAGRFGVTPRLVRKRASSLCCGVPYVIPTADAGAIAHAWFEAIDAFPRLTQGDMMHAFGLVMMKMGLHVCLMDNVDLDFWPFERPLREFIHYGYGDENWNKRNYATSEQARTVWRPGVTAPADTILSEILGQLVEAGDFYDAGLV